MPYQSIFSNGRTNLSQVLGGKTNPYATDFHPGQYYVDPRSISIQQGNSGAINYKNAQDIAYAVQNLKNFRNPEDQAKILQHATKYGFIDKKKSSEAINALLSGGPQLQLNPFEKFSVGTVGFGKKIAQPFADVGSGAVKQLNYLFGPTRSQQGQPTALASQKAAQGNQDYAKLLKTKYGNGKNIGSNELMLANHMASSGANINEIDKFLSTAAKAYDANNKKIAGDAMQIGSYGFGIPEAKSLLQLNRAGGVAALKTMIPGAIGGEGMALADNQDLKHQLIDTAAGAALGLLPAGASLTRRGVTKSFDNLGIHIKPVSADEIGSHIVSMADSEKAAKRAGVKATAMKEWVNRHYQLSQFVADAEQKLGYKLPKDVNPAELMKLQSGSEGAAIEHIKETAGWMKDVPAEIKHDGDAYGYAKKVLSTPDKYDPKVVAENQRILDAVEKKYAGNMSQITDYTDKVRQMFDTLPDLYKKHGLIDEATYQAMKANKDYFGKLEVLQHHTDNAFRGGNSVSTRDAGILKKIKGHGVNDQIAPAAESYTKQALTTFHDLINNKISKSIGDIAEKLGNDPNVYKLRNTADVQARQGIFKFLAETKPGKLAVAKLLKQRGAELRKLTTELNRLNKQGLQISLKKSANDVEKPILSGVKDVIKNPRTIAGKKTQPLLSDLPLTGTVQTKQFSRSLTSRETKSLVQSLITEDPAQLKKIRKMIEARDPKMKALFDDVEKLRDELAGFNQARGDAWKSLSNYSDKQLPKGMTRISYLDNGVRNEVAVPQEIGDILTGADKATIESVTSTLGKINNIFRAAVTTYNPLFVFFRNPVRDYRSFMMNSKNISVVRTLDKYVAGLIDAVTNGKWSQEFKANYGGQAGFFANEGGLNGKGIAGITNQLTKKRSVIKAVVSSPKAFMDKMSESIEMAPRVAEYKAAVQKGLSKEEAAVAGREITVDFAQGGRSMKMLNHFIPFTNARAQGTRRMMQAFRDNPKRALAVWGATSIAPIASLMAWNHQHQDVWNDIPDYEKQNNFIFIWGNQKDKSGRYTQVVKMPKADIDKFLGNTLESMIDHAYKGDMLKGQQLVNSIIDGVSNIAPITFANNGQITPASLESGLEPPVMKAVTENMGDQGYSGFKDSPVIPDSMKGAPANEQVKPNTPWLAKFIGNHAGVSPLKVDNTIQNLAGSVPNDVVNAATLNKGTAKRMENGVVGSSGGKSEVDFYKVYGPAANTKDYRQSQINKAIHAGDVKKAQRIADEYNRDIDARFKKYYESHPGSAVQSLNNGANPIDLITNLKLNVQISKKGSAYIKR